VTFLYAEEVDRVDDEGNMETPRGTYIFRRNLPLPPFVGLRVILDADMDPYRVSDVQVMSSGEIVLMVDELCFPVVWGWERISDDDAGIMKLW
jgi:hypothetical protein